MILNWRRTWIRVALKLFFLLSFWQGPEAWEHPLRLTGPYCPHRLWPLQRRPWGQRYNNNLLRDARGTKQILRLPLIPISTDNCWTCVNSLLFLTVLGPRGSPETGVRPHGWLVVSGICALRDALWTCKWNLWLYASLHNSTACFLY